MQKSYKSHNWIKENSLWIKSKKILRNQRGMVTYYDFIAVPPGGEWLPTNIGGCIFWARSDLAWQDAAKTVPCTNESLIWTGEDKSGIGNDVIQATEAARPVYLTNQANGHPCWRLDGIDDTLVRAGFVYSRPLVVYVVFRPITYENMDAIFSLGGIGYSLIQYGEFQYYLYDNGTWWTYAITINHAEWAIARVHFSDGALNGLRKNNLAEGTTAAGNNVADSLGIGASSYGGYHINMDMAEIVIYNALPSSADDALMMNYLNTQAQGTGYAIY